MKFADIGVAILIFVVNAYIKLHSDFGIDVERYSVILENGIPEWSAYYYKEFISWGILNFLAFLPGQLGVPVLLIFLDVGLAVLLIVACRESWFSSSRFFYFYVSFAFVLLSFNVLRQYISVIFLVVAVVGAIGNKKKSFVFWALFAVLSHNGSVLSVFPLAFILIKDKKPAVKIFAFLGGVAILTLLSGSGVFERIFSSGDEVLDEPLWKVALYALISLYLNFLILLKMKENLKDSNGKLNQLENLKFCIWILFGSGILISILPFPEWMASRNWLSIISVQAILFLCLGDSRYSKRMAVISFFGYFVPMAIFLVNHPGAQQMMFGA